MILCAASTIVRALSPEHVNTGFKAIFEIVKFWFAAWCSSEYQEAVTEYQETVYKVVLYKNITKSGKI